MKREDHLVEPRLEKPLLALHAAMDMEAFWKASRRLLREAMPSLFVGAGFQFSPLMPMFLVRDRLPAPAPDWFPDFFVVHPVPPFVAAHPGVRFVNTDHVFPDERAMLRHPFYLRFMKPDNWRYTCGMVFWQRARTIGMLSLGRSPEQGDFTPAELRLARRLYPHFEVALRRVGRAERERGRRAAFEKFLRRLPLPTLLLNWELQLVYENRAGRECCAVWARGPDAVRGEKREATIVPAEVLRECERLKAQWEAAPAPNAPPSPRGDPIHHPRWPRLLASAEIEQLSAAAVGRPHFLVQFEDIHDGGDTRDETEQNNLPHLARLTPREREIALLVREGCSNQEIADRLGCSLPTVKKQLHAVFHKLEVPSRSRLMALLR